MCMCRWMAGGGHSILSVQYTMYGVPDVAATRTGCGQFMVIIPLR